MLLAPAGRTTCRSCDWCPAGQPELRSVLHVRSTAIIIPTTKFVFSSIHLARRRRQATQLPDNGDIWRAADNFLKLGRCRRPSRWKYRDKNRRRRLVYRSPCNTVSCGPTSLTKVLYSVLESIPISRFDTYRLWLKNT